MEPCAGAGPSGRPRAGSRASARVAVRFADAAAFANVNTPAELAAQADNAPRIAP